MQARECYYTIPNKLRAINALGVAVKDGIQAFLFDPEFSEGFASEFVPVSGV